jgi:hypothetical protein
MRVLYRSRLSRSRHAEPVYEQAGPTKFCCAEMCRWWGRLIGFGVHGCSASTSKTVNLYLSHPQANGKVVCEVVPADFCPWCGEAVEPCRVK